MSGPVIIIIYSGTDPATKERAVGAGIKPMTIWREVARSND